MQPALRDCHERQGEHRRMLGSWYVDHHGLIFATETGNLSSDPHPAATMAS